MLTLFLLVTVLVLSSSSNVYATETAANYNLSGTNKSTGYEYILEDSANFIDDAVKGKLISQMKKTTEYCNIAVVTTTSHPYGSTESYAVNTFEGYFGTGANGVIFVIDRDLNEIYLACEGSTQRTIPNSKCNSICDNTYIYATSSHDYDYFTCCMETIDQVNTVLAGGHISHCVHGGLFSCHVSGNQEDMPPRRNHRSQSHSCLECDCRVHQDRYEARLCIGLRCPVSESQ